MNAGGLQGIACERADLRSFRDGDHNRIVCCRSPSNGFLEVHLDDGGSMLKLDMALVPALSPHGVLKLRPQDDAATITSEFADRIGSAFSRGSGHGLLWLGANEVGTALPPPLSYWREIGTRYVTGLCMLPGMAEGGAKPAVPPPSTTELEQMAAAAPPMIGAEYLNVAVLADLWTATDTAFDVELGQAGLNVQEFLKRRNPAWNLVGRVNFNLAENRKDEDAPFAFLATYTTRLSARGQGSAPPARQGIAGIFWSQEPRSSAVPAGACSTGR